MTKYWGEREREGQTEKETREAEVGMGNCVQPEAIKL